VKHPAEVAFPAKARINGWHDSVAFEKCEVCGELAAAKKRARIALTTPRAAAELVQVFGLVLGPGADFEVCIDQVRNISQKKRRTLLAFLLNMQREIADSGRLCPLGRRGAGLFR
jgi:hypothetical protein